MTDAFIELLNYYDSTMRNVIALPSGRTQEQKDRVRLALIKAFETRATPADQDLYTLDQMRDYAEAFYKSRIEGYDLVARATPADHMPTAAEKVDAGSVPVATRDMNCPKCHGVGHVPADGYGRDDCPVCFAAPPSPQVSDNVRDAVIEECAAIFASTGIFAQCGAAIRALKSGLPQKSEDES